MSEAVNEIQENQVPQPAPEQQPVESKKKTKFVRNVSVKQCVGTIIFCLVVCLTILIPFTFGSDGIHMTMEFLPLLGNGDILKAGDSVQVGLQALLPIDKSILDIFVLGINYYILAFFGIILFDILAALLLAICRFNVMRIIFKIFSIIFGIAMILVAAIGIIYIIGFFAPFITGAQLIENIMPALEKSGILFVLVTIVLACFMSIKQFRWFGKRW